MKCLVPISLLFLPLFGRAQQADSLVLLGEVEIRPVDRNEMDAGKKRRSYQNAPQLIFPAGSVSDVLQANSPYSIKSYGAGLLSSISMRGSGAAHTPVLWNGINLQSSMNGQLDLSLLPSGFFNSIDVIPGGGADLFGSGAIGGVIQLNNSYRINQGLRLGASIMGGNFGNNAGMLEAGWGKKRIGVKATVFRQAAQNNYPYINRSLQNKPVEVLQNAACSTVGVMVESQLLLSKRLQVSIFNWYQNSEREIPPTMIIPVSLAMQKDETSRHLALWNMQHKRWNFTMRNAVLFENLWYNDANISLFSSNKAYSVINEVESQRKIAHGNLLIGFNSTENRANVDGYGSAEWKKQSRQALFAAFQKQYLNDKAKWKISVRQEINDKKLAPIALSAGTDIGFNRLSMRAQMAKVYRLPNFNEQYWVPGGNRDVLPENGYTAEAGAGYVIRKDSSMLGFSLTSFYSIIDNWIIWLPQAGYWTPTNLQQVHSRGLEWETEYRQSSAASLFALHAVYGGSLTFSSNERAKSQGDVSVGKQLIYVPFQKHYAKLQVIYKKFWFSYTHQLTGARYTSSDNSSILKAFHTGDMVVLYQYTKPGYMITFFGSLRNVWNHKYEIIEWRPMPGRNFEIGIKLTYNK